MFQVSTEWTVGNKFDGATVILDCQKIGVMVSSYTYSKDQNHT